MTDPKTCRRPSVRLFLAAIALAAAQGCGDEVELGDVHGTVTMDGKPLPDATIRFIPAAGGRSALGRTDAQGRYEMLYSATASGALVGPVRVEITVAEEFEDRMGNTRMKPELVPERYNVDSELTAEVGHDSNEFNFDLESK